MIQDRKKDRKDARVLHDGRYLTLLDENGWEYVTRRGVTGIVVIVAITKDEDGVRRVILVEQPRTAVHKRTIELPAGLVGDNDGQGAESLAEAGARELEEETGYAAAQLVLLASGPVAVGMSDEIISFFEARGLRRVGPGGGVDNEDITVHEVPLRELRAFLAEKERAGLAVDPKIYAGLFMAGIGPDERSA
jgi:ADP-ribose pyrophosphatase